jgi:hypothetical protein
MGGQADMHCGRPLSPVSAIATISQPVCPLTDEQETDAPAFAQRGVQVSK